MRRKFLATAAALLVVLAAGVAAQARPDFSGTWMMDPAPAADAGGRGAGRGAAGFQPGFGPQVTIKQDATTLTINRGQGSPLIYKLDGSPSKNTVTRDGQPQDQVAKASWEGNKLVIATEVNFQGNTAEQRR